MKMVLIIDKPKNCDECPLADSEQDICRATDEYIGHGVRIKYICPLKPLPEKKYCDYEIDFDEDFEFVRGYNQCLFEITGEERYKE